MMTVGSHLDIPDDEEEEINVEEEEEGEEGMKEEVAEDLRTAGDIDYSQKRKQRR